MVFRVKNDESRDSNFDRQLFISQLFQAEMIVQFVTFVSEIMKKVVKISFFVNMFKKKQT